MLNEMYRIFKFIIESLIHIWPLLLLTIPLSIAIKEIGVSKNLNTLLKKHIIVSILIATLIGAIAPFCSCSVVPVIASMLIMGVPMAPIMSFWLASPSMDPEIFFLSVASLGWPLAVARITATFIMSLAGGYLTHLIIGKKHQTNDVFLKVSSSCDSSCQEKDTTLDNNKRKINLKKILGESKDSVWMVLKFLTIAYLLEAIIIFYVPESIVVGIFGTNKFVSIFRATLIGIPLYTTNISALGLIGGLLDKGLSQGAALSFLIAGATTTIPAMAAVYKLVHKKIFFLYLGITVTFSLLSGVVFELISIIYL